MPEVSVLKIVSKIIVFVKESSSRKLLQQVAKQQWLKKNKTIWSTECVRVTNSNCTFLLLPLCVIKPVYIWHPVSQIEVLEYQRLGRVSSFLCQQLTIAFPFLTSQFTPKIKEELTEYTEVY